MLDNKKNKLKEKNKKGIFLLLKQTLIATWKSKLQLVILLLLTAFATALLTGTWISYNRIVAEANYLGIEDAKFDAVLPYNSYSSTAENYTQMPDQDFSLSVGKIYYSNGSSGTKNALYFDNTKIGKEIKAITTNDLNITYNRQTPGDNKTPIVSINSMAWTNPSHPLSFDLSQPDVQASLYGQLVNKERLTNNPILKQNYEQAINSLYQNLFLNQEANNIFNSIKTYINNWISKYKTSPFLNDSDQDFTNGILSHKINWHNSSKGTNNNFCIPDQLAINDANDLATLQRVVVQTSTTDPKITDDPADYGMDGQWMTINRNFADTTNVADAQNFVNGYSSPYNYGLLSDNASNEQTYSYITAAAAAALQQRNIFVVNQFVASAFVNANDQTVTAKVVDLGSPTNCNHINLKVFQGVYPNAKNQVVISPQYAEKKGVKPGDTITINKRKFLVSGIGSDAYNFYPIINPLDPIPNTLNQFIVYTLPQTYNDGNWYDTNSKTDDSLMYFLPWKNVNVSNFNLDSFNDLFQPSIFSNNGATDLNQDSYDAYLQQKYQYINPNPNAVTNYKIIPNLVITKSDSQFSIYNEGQTMFSSILLVFKDAAFVGVLFLSLIVVFITFLIVKKAVQKSQVSMGILKSIGYGPWKIAISYLAYALFALVIAIPIGWVAGLFLQIYFASIFDSLFSLPYNIFSFNGIPILIAIALLISFIIIAALFTSYCMLKKDTLKLIKKDSDINVGKKSYFNTSHKVIKNFKLKFWISLSRTSWKKILTTAGVIGLASLSITATISIPATINAMKNNYFKTQKYRNYYQYQDPIPNMPLSKYGLYDWTNLTKPNDELYYPVHGSMPWPDDIIVNREDKTTGQETKLFYYNPLLYKKNSDNSDNFVINSLDAPAPYSNPNGIVYTFKHYTDPNDPELHTIADLVGKIEANLQSQQNGPLNVDLLAWNFTWLGGRAFSNDLLTDLQAQDNSLDKNFSNNLLGFATNLLPGIIGVPNTGVLPGPEAIVQILKQTLPGYIRQLLDAKGPQAYDYFSIGHNTVAYDSTNNSSIGGPDEELVTQFQLGSNTPGLSNKGLLDVVGLNPNTKMIVMPHSMVNALKFNPKSHPLNKDSVIPMVINQAFASKYNLGVGEEFSAAPSVKTLYYLDNSGQYKVLPKSDWYYGPNPLTKENINSNPWDLSANRWNYRGSKPINGETDYTDSFGYTYNGIYQDGKVPTNNQTAPQSWNNVNDVWLKLPSDISNNAWNGTIPQVNGQPYSLSGLTNITADGQQAAAGSWIKPFSLNLTSNAPVNPVTSLINRPSEWYGGMLNNGILKTDNNLHLGTLNSDVSNAPKWWNNLMGKTVPFVHNYKIVGIQNSYDSPRAYINQQLANYVLGYSDVSNVAGTNDSVIISNPIYAAGNSGKGPLQWFSGKLSSENNIYDLIARLSFKRQSDDYTLYGMTVNGNQQVPLVANSDLLSKKEEMLDKMSNLAFSGSAVFIISTVVCSVLIVIMITDLFTDQFRRFMGQMKSEGYRNWEINSFTLGIFTPWVFIGYVVGLLIGIIVVFGFIKILSTLTTLVLPFIFIWWIIPFSLLLIGGIYLSTFIINNYELNRMKLVELLSSSD